MGFDPTPHLLRLRGRGGAGEYLPVKWRLVWLRTEHPDATIETEHVVLDDTVAIFKATVCLPSGGKATGYGSETPGDFKDYIEKAEAKALGRALGALGFGTQFAEDDAALLVDSPVERPAPHPVRAAPLPGRSDPVGSPRTLPERVDAAVAANVDTVTGEVTGDLDLIEQAIAGASREPPPDLHWSSAERRWLDNIKRATTEASLDVIAANLPKVGGHPHRMLMDALEARRQEVAARR